ncbi:hypothetical protein N007_20860 [Alicyclobacillus acidoterrestris ATCC 49025]|nr:hypothetical protein N007_20860 [Alicyclobacillus acidoterrestris ATCC 49025]
MFESGATVGEKVGNEIRMKTGTEEGEFGRFKGVQKKTPLGVSGGNTIKRFTQDNECIIIALPDFLLEVTFPYTT